MVREAEDLLLDRALGVQPGQLQEVLGSLEVLQSKQGWGLRSLWGGLVWWSLWEAESWALPIPSGPWAFSNFSSLPVFCLVQGILTQQGESCEPHLTGGRWLLGVEVDPTGCQS